MYQVNESGFLEEYRDDGDDWTGEHGWDDLYPWDMYDTSIFITEVN